MMKVFLNQSFSFPFVIFFDEMHNFSKRKYFYLSTVSIEIGVISALGKHSLA